MNLTVELEGRERFTVATRPVDNIRFEDTARKHKWGAVQDSPMRYLYFLAYAACTRTGEWDAQSGFDAFMAALVDVSPDEDTETPTPPGPGPG